MIQANLLKIAPSNGGDELFEDILARPGLRVERIVSRGHITPPDQPYRQDRDEWVLLLEGNARLRLEGRDEITLETGAHLLIPAGTRHWVTHTADPTIWLALHIGKA